MRRLTTLCLILVCGVSLCLLGCDAGDGDGGTGVGGGNGDGPDPGTPDPNDPADLPDPTDEPGLAWSVDGSISDSTPNEIPADCGFDEAQVGSGMNSHISNLNLYGLELEDGTKEKYELHYDCGGGSKAVWVFLSTGWCGACNAYAKTVEKVYNEYKDQGLRVLWIVGEGEISDGVKPPITKASFAEYFTKHSPMSFTVVRDPGFDGTYSQLDNTSPSLPHQYILDGTTMELIYKQGGTNKEGVKTVAETVGLDLAEVEAFLDITFAAAE